MNKQDTAVSFVKITIGYKTSEGVKETEFVVTEDEFDIASFNFSQNRKFKQAKDEDGLPLGFEPTGEYEWALKLKYIKPQE